jgi:hypothetical protein
VPADIAYLRKHYSSLSDEALLDVDRTELTEAAQQCYDDELKDRRLTTAPGFEATEQEEDDGGPPVIHDGGADESECVCSFPAPQGGAPPAGALDAQVVLQAAGIPCSLETHEFDEEEAVRQGPLQALWVVVPGKLMMLARSLLDKEIFNAEVEEVWRAYFETLSDEELRDADMKRLLSGFVDRIERVTRAYNEEKSRRGV